MILPYQDYGLFYKFIEAYLPVGFHGIDREDLLVLQLEGMTEANNQFFFVADIIETKIMWASLRSTKMVGVEPGELNPHIFYEATHPDDLNRHMLGRSKMYSIANDLYSAGKGNALMSSNIRLRNSRGEYPDLLFQLFFFCGTFPYKTVYIIQVMTELSSFKSRKQGFHYYVGDDLFNFRFPDDKLLDLGNPLSNREFEILMLIDSGLTSEQTGKSLFVSKFTIDTHRRNILEKTGKTRISDVISDFHKRGLF